MRSCRRQEQIARFVFSGRVLKAQTKKEEDIILCKNVKHIFICYNYNTVFVVYLVLPLPHPNILLLLFLFYRFVLYDFLSKNKKIFLI